MYIVGYIDDENVMINDYIKRLSRREIELKIAPVGDMYCIKKWIIDENIESMMIDYRLGEQYGFNGTDLFTFLDDELPGFPCIILTSYTDSSIQENRVVQNCIFDRNNLDSRDEKFDQFCEMLKQSTEVFKNNLIKYKSKFEELYNKKIDDTISMEEEEELLSVYKILRSYGEVDDISSQMLTTRLSSSIDDLLKKIDDLLDE